MAQGGSHVPWSALGPPEKAKKLLREALTDPVGFTETLIIAGRSDEHGNPIVLDAKQRDALNSLRDGRWPVLQKARGTGGTTVVSWALIWWLYVHPTAKIIANAPKIEQLEINLWPETKKWIVGSFIEDDFEWTKSKIFLKGREQENFAVMQTAAEPERLQGGHDPFMMIIIEEASGVSDASFIALMGSMTQEHNAMVILFNPNFERGFAREKYKDPHGRFHPIHMPATNIKGDWRHSLVTDEQIVNLRRYGRDSPEFRIFGLGLPPITDSSSVIPWEWVYEASEFELPESKDYRRIWGVDPAVTGDRCGFCERRGTKVTRIDAWRGLETMQIAGRVKFMFDDLEKHLQPHEIFIDIIGVGRGVYDRLREQGLPVRGISVARSPSAKDTFKRLRDELWWKAREWFETRAVSMHGLDKDFLREMMNELTTPRYAIASNGVVEVESKKDFKKRLDGNSPDMADAFCLTLAGGVDIIEDHHVDRYRKKRIEPVRSWRAA